MRSLLLLLGVLFSISSSAQEQRKIYGRVVDRAGQEIPLVAVFYGQQQTPCSDDGSFGITTDADSAITLVFRKLGYKHRDMVVAEDFDDTLLVVLDEAAVSLNAVSVTGAQENVREKIMGSRKLRYSGGCYMEYGDEIAMYLEADSSRHGILKEVYFFITGEGYPWSRFRVHIYDDNNPDSSVFEPYKELTAGDTIIAHAGRGGEWVRVDISARSIPVGRGVYISMEWMKGYRNEPFPVFQKVLSSYKIQHRGRNEFYGQVLGLTHDYGMTSYHFIRYHEAPGKWIYYNPGGNGRIRRGSVQIRNWFNPMVYATYTYVKE